MPYCIYLFPILHAVHDIQKISYPENIRLGEDVLKASSVQHFLYFKTSSRHNCKTSSWRGLEDILKTSWRRCLTSTSWRCPGRRLEDVLKTSWRHLQDVLKTFLEDVLQLRLEGVFLTSWKTKNFYAEDVLENKKCLLYINYYY